MNGLENRKYATYFAYDFAKEGGAVGDITLRGGSLPAGAVVNNVIVDVQTALTSGGAATVALKLKDAADIKAAAVLTSYTAGVKAGVPNGAASNAVKTTANGGVIMTVAVADLTAGKLVVALEYFITE